MNYLISIIIVSFSFSTFANIGFEKGNEFIVTPAEGRVFVRCNNPTDPGWGSHYCSGYFSNPGSHAKLVNTGTPINADKVEALATHADKSTRKKDEDFHSDSQSSDAFNITIKTLLQRPLLERGINTIDYKFTKEGRTVQSGQFQAVLEVGESVVCEDLSISLAGNCNTSSACAAYWNRQPRCE